MQKNRFLLLAAAAIAMLSYGAMPVCWAETQAEDSYRIAPEDALGILVHDHPELTVSAAVVADGTISVPLAGTVPVRGLTVEEVRRKLVELYDKKYIPNPDIAVSLTKSRPRQYFIYGEVKAPGVYSLPENLTVLRAIAVAGGFTDYSDKRNIKILRKADGVETVIKVDVGKIERGSFGEDAALMPDDVISVPETFI